MQKIFITKSSKETQGLGKILAEELKDDPASLRQAVVSASRGGGILALEGELGSGKTTFTQGFLAGLRVKGPYTSPTFLVIKNYKKKIPIKPKSSNTKTQNIYHIDTYRIKDKDILSLGWEEIISNPENIVIIEWADRIKKIIPKHALWIKFKWIDNNTREIKLYENKIK
jgi:tRNA threonylcarbamoyladenosine biosynthesis protein TsaE